MISEHAFVSDPLAYLHFNEDVAQCADEAVADLVRCWAGGDARLRERSGANTFGLRTSDEDRDHNGIGCEM